MSNIWQFQEANSKFSKVVERTLEKGFQIIIQDGRKIVVILPFDEYERLTKRTESLAQFLMESPLAGSELIIERDKSTPRHL